MKISYFAFSVIFVGCSSYLKLPMKYIFVLQTYLLAEEDIHKEKTIVINKTLTTILLSPHSQYQCVGLVALWAIPAYA